MNIRKKKLWLIILVLLILLVLSIIGSCFLGTASIKFSMVIDIIKSQIFGIEGGAVSESSIYIVKELRVPRTILAIFIGGGLAVAGVAMQALTQNVLAEPYMLGVSAGALAFVAITIMFSTGSYLNSYGIFGAAFLGSMVALIFVYFIGGAGKKTSNNRLILAGMAVSIVLNAFSNLCIIISPSDSNIKNLISWSMGSLAGARWGNIMIPCIGILVGVVVLILTSRNYDIISLGDETSISMGVPIKKVKKWTIILISMITGLAVASSGLIGLVGFIIPHIVRILFGAQHRRLIPLSFLIGGLFLIWMDILARTIAPPSDLPIGIFTALCGGPFFIWLLYKGRKR